VNISPLQISWLLNYISEADAEFWQAIDIEAKFEVLALDFTHLGDVS
jgi:hypothetical protein